MNIRAWAWCICSGVVSTACASIVSAQAPAPLNYPARTVRVVVAFAPGGGTDVIARFFSQKLSESLGQSFIVDNRPGAGSNIGADHVAKAAPDGYTLLMAIASLTINVSLYGKLPYDPVRDFTAIGTVAITPNGFAVHPSMPVKSMRELIALARARPGEITYASPGSGTPVHLSMELFRSMAGIKLLHIPYNGSGPATTAVLGGQVPLLATTLPIALPHARAGKLRMLGVTSAERTPLAPEFPTVAESAGLPGYEASVWYGLLAPAGTPAAIVNKLNAAIERLLQLREVRERMATLGFDPYRSTPAAFAELIKSDIVKWGKVVRESGARAD
jgi:tripartite-type tricarboxylate transporter receptor subunit TctC